VSSTLLRVASALVLLLLTQPATGAPAQRPLQIAAGADVQAAVDAAGDGDTLVLLAGMHRGPVRVSRAVTIRGQGAATIMGDGRGSVLLLEADGTVIENIEIRGSGRNLARDDAGILVTASRVRIAGVRLRENLHGIYVRGAEDVHLENNHVTGLGATLGAPERGGDVHHDDLHHAPPRVQALMGNGLHLWNADGAVVEGNHVEHVRDGIYVAHTYRAAFRRNRVHDSRYAIHYMYSSDNEVSGNELWGNVAGAALMFSRNLDVAANVFRDHRGFRAYGLLLQNVDGSVFRRNALRGNRAGVRLQNSSANRFEDNHVAANLVGMSLNSSSRDNIFTRNRLGPNVKQLALTGPVPPTQWSVGRAGNHWHGALALDLTGDGVSELPHHVVDLVADRREAFPLVQLLIGSPGIRGLEWALSRAPVPGARYVTDPYPLVR
jgi:nitrous oxidase accessory protein